MLVLVYNHIIACIDIRMQLINFPQVVLNCLGLFVGFIGSKYLVCMVSPLALLMYPRVLQCTSTLTKRIVKKRTYFEFECN